ncbi:hypothetical protein [Streptomyces goshikiensis]|uniref:hypothetical protein n=1 Tax=Streptomyces goshikiensis TaxID=1942 RepID=UPI00368282EF
MTTSSRPDPRRLGVPKEVVNQAARTLRNARGSLSTFLDELNQADATVGVAGTDDAWIAAAHHRHRTGLRRLLSWSAITASLTIAHALDHVVAIERTLVGEPVSIWPTVSLSRTVQEGTIRICHTRQAQVSSEERMVRIAAAMLADARAHLTAAKEFDSRVLPEAERAWQRAEATVVSAGCSIGLDGKSRPVRVELGAHSAPFKFELTAAAKTRKTHLPSWYRLSSGAAHSSMWLVRQAVGFDDEGKPSLYADSETVSAAVLAVLGAFEDLTETFGTYHGHTGTAQAVATLRRRTLVVVELQKRWREKAARDAEALFS